VLIGPIILVLMGAGLLMTGLQGLRLHTDDNAVIGLDEAQLKRRRIMLRGSSYACIASGTLLMSLAGLVTYALIELLSSS
jgi:hypothetical protein